MTRWQALSAESRDTFWRSLQTLNATRIVIAMVLLLYLSFDSRGVRASQHLYAETCITYLVAALGFGALTIYWRRRFLIQLGAQIAFDIAVILQPDLDLAFQPGLAHLRDPAFHVRRDVIRRRVLNDADGERGGCHETKLLAISL